MSSDKLHVGFLLTGLDGGGAERAVPNLAASLIARGHRADLVIPRLAGDYRAGVAGGMHIRRARIPGTDKKLLRALRRAGVHVEATTVNPFRVARSWLTLGRKGLDLPVRKRHHIGDPRGAGRRRAGGQHRRALRSARDTRWLGRPVAGGRRAGAGRTLRGARPTAEALRARADDFSEEKAAGTYIALFEELVRR